MTFGKRREDVGQLLGRALRSGADVTVEERCRILQRARTLSPGGTPEVDERLLAEIDLSDPCASRAGWTWRDAARNP